MKKTYKNPTITVVNIQTVVMNSTSVGVGSTYHGTTVLSRNAGGIWDDELEEDFD